MIHQKPIAIIDVGSNSVRVVIYDGLNRSPFILFNERVLAELGKDLTTTGYLHPEGVELAFKNLERFKAVVDNMDADYFAVATAAVREAVDGPTFVQRLKQELNLDLTIISGEEEARLGTLGLYSSVSKLKGVAGDLGGGSLELTKADGGQFLHSKSLPLGGLRLANAFHDADKLKQTIRAELRPLDWLNDAATGESFYAIGGAWRALAEHYIYKNAYPLSIIHNLTIPIDIMLEFTKKIAQYSPEKADKKLVSTSKRRRETLPVAARLMYEILTMVKPKQVVFSAFGVRDGLLYDHLELDIQQTDPLLVRCAMLEEQFSRFNNGRTVYHWSKAIVKNETPAYQRIYLAACLLNEVGWFEHKNYRSHLSYLRILTQRFGGGLSHAERIILAIALYVSYGEKITDTALAATVALLSKEEVHLSERFGMAIRLARRLGGGPIEAFSHTILDYDAQHLTLTIDDKLRPFMGQHIEQLIHDLAGNLGCSPRLEMVHGALQAS